MAWEPSPVSLVDGRVVLSDSEEWRHECEARHVLNMPTLSQRQGYLYGYRNEVTRRHEPGIEAKRGKAELRRLESTIKKLWKLRHASGLVTSHQSQTDSANEQIDLYFEPARQSDIFA